ncbi:general transcription factor 3C polypeptide 5, putative [Plasmodium ovale wallikeri]|uniref:General transcription factor 3C polypeptide 5, putative n=1 Tax=Plasmodium ovale wallikeri TaxID=864142 RepID=A0A1A8ZKR2_PLAOA|nr:general transcription factor 3C polypeptide 5, putative [Plasmodium ovale wallikeri]
MCHTEWNEQQMYQAQDIPREPREGGEDNMCVQVKRKKDRNDSINFEKLKRNEYICVEVPGKIRKGGTGLSAVESLGGLNKITELFKHHRRDCKDDHKGRHRDECMGLRIDEQMGLHWDNRKGKHRIRNKDEQKYDDSLILRINNNDMFSSFISASCTKANNILIKIKKTKKNRYTFEFLGFIKYLYYFDNMSDFYYIPSFYNRFDYNTNYIHYFTGRNQRKGARRRQRHTGKPLPQNVHEPLHNGRHELDGTLTSGSHPNSTYEEGSPDFPAQHDRSTILWPNRGKMDVVEISQYEHQNENALKCKQVFREFPLTSDFDCDYHACNGKEIHARSFRSDNVNLMGHDMERNGYIHKGDINDMSNRKSNHGMENHPVVSCTAECTDEGKSFFEKGRNDNAHVVDCNVFSSGKLRENSSDLVISEGVYNEKRKENDVTSSHIDNTNDCMYNSVGEGMNNIMSNQSNTHLRKKTYEYFNQEMNISCDYPQYGNATAVNTKDRNMNVCSPVDNSVYHNMLESDDQSDYYISDVEEMKLYKKIISSNITLDMIEEKREVVFSSDESEAYELNCCIHSKSTSPYDYRNYNSAITSKYMRDYKYFISKFTAPINSKTEIKKEDLEIFVKDLVITKKDRERFNTNKIPFITEFEKGKTLNRNTDRMECQEKRSTGKSLPYDVHAHVHGESSNRILIENDHDGQHEKTNHEKGTYEKASYEQANYVDSLLLQKEKPRRESDKKGKEEKCDIIKENDNSDSSNKQGNQIIVSKKTVHCNPTARYDDPIVPSIPFDSALKKYVSDKLYKRTKALFDIRPIWSREVLVQHLENTSTYCLKSCFSKICFYFSNGPWRRTYCKYGYDPRKDPSSYIYQTIDFRDIYYRDKNAKSIDEINKDIVKRKTFLNNTLTNIIQKINNSASMNEEMNRTSKDNDNKMKREMQKEDVFREHSNIITEHSLGCNKNYDESMNTQSSNHPLYNTSSIVHTNDLSIEKDVVDIHSIEGHHYEYDQEINEILSFLKRSNTFHLRQNFSAEVHFSVSPLKLSMMYQYIDIFDINVLNYLLNVKTQEICTKDNGWLSSKDVSKIRDILFVRSMTLRRAHSK